MSILKKFKLKIDQNKAFLFILISTSVIWLVLQLSKSYTTDLQLNYLVKDLPKSLNVSENKSISLNVTSNGFALLRLNIFRPKLDFSYSDFERSDSLLSLNQAKLNQIIASELKLEKENINANQGLKLNYYKRFSKELKVLPTLKLSFQPGFDTIDPIDYSPKKVTIFGKIDDLSPVDTIYTQLIKHDNINDSISGLAELNLNEISFERINTASIAYQINVDRFTEKTIKLQVDVINVPEEIELSIYPKEIELSFELPLSKYDLVTADNFKLICDFSQAQPNDSFLILKLKSYPKYIKYPRLSTKRINFLIKE